MSSPSFGKLPREALMPMAKFILAADLVLLAAPVIAAYNGFMFRAAWAAVMVVSMVVAELLGSLEPYDFIGWGNSLGASEVLANETSVLAASFGGIAFGSLLAVCLYRSKKVATKDHIHGS